MRPKYHYTPERGWVNDPNGLIYYKNQWHLFAQHYPDAPKWGPMHWAHAVSDDLLNWRRLPIALYPDSMGMCFSGSAAEIDGKICLMYTSHGAAERQCVAFSEDGVNFHKYRGNPVIENPGIKDFRDPKIFLNPVVGGYSVAVAAGERVDFFHSENLIDWRKTGEFSDQARVAGIHECPDVVKIGDKWVMIASMILPGGAGNRTQYVIGDFDGDKFMLTDEFSEPAWIDAGWDNYAPVTFFGADKPIMLGWARCWAYADRLPTRGYSGMTTLARELALIQTRDGLRLAQSPIIDGVTGEYRDSRDIASQHFRIRARCQARFSLALISDIGERLIISSDGNNITVDRRNAGEVGGAHELREEKYGIISAKRHIGGDICIDIIFDMCIAEIFADGGLFAATAPVFPERPYTKIAAQNCEVAIADLF